MTGLAGNAIGVFKIIGASFGPICGAMAVDYVLSGCKWAGPRAGYNPAGWLAWGFGFSIGIMPNSENEKLSAQMDIALDEDGFFKNSDDLNKTSTSNDGMFIAGTAQGPKNIAASMAHAGQAASGVLKYLGVTK